VKDNQLLVKKYNERSTEVKQLKEQLKKAPGNIERVAMRVIERSAAATAQSATTANPRASIQVK
jgi:hypothetical protein